MRFIRVLSVFVILAGGSLISASPSDASVATGFCGVCHQEGCPTGLSAKNNCQAVCGGSESPYCTWSPFCLGSPDGGPLLVCFPDDM